MPHTLTVAEIRNGTGFKPDASFVRVEDYTEMQRSFRERTEALTRSADECIALANERYAMRAALLKIVKYADSEPDGGETVAMHRANIERARKLTTPTDGLATLPGIAGRMQDGTASAADLVAADAHARARMRP